MTSVIRGTDDAPARDRGGPEDGARTAETEQHAGPGADSAASFRPGADDAATHGVDDVLGRQVALVHLPPTDGRALDARIARVRDLAALHHPHLAEMYDVDGLEPGVESVLVLERVPGTPLGDVAAAGPLPLDRAAELGARVASALAHAHEHGVVHGHLGPASILLTDTQHVWLVGFAAELRTPVLDDPEHPGDDDRGADLRALSTTLLAATAWGSDRKELDVALGPATQGRGSAAELADRLLDLTRSHLTVAQENPVALGAIDDAVTEPSAARGTEPSAARGMGPTAVAAAGGVAASDVVAGSAPGGRAAPATPAGPGRDERPAGRRTSRARVLAVAAAAAALLAGSGIGIWAQNRAGSDPPPSPAASPSSLPPDRGGGAGAPPLTVVAPDTGSAGLHGGSHETPSGRSAHTGSGGVATSSVPAPSGSGSERSGSGDSGPGSTSAPSPSTGSSGSASTTAPGSSSSTTSGSSSSPSSGSSSSSTSAGSGSSSSGSGSTSSGSGPGGGHRGSGDDEAGGDVGGGGHDAPGSPGSSGH